VRIDAEDLAEQRVRVLPVALRIVRDATVPGPDVEVTVRSEEEEAAVVVGGEIGHLEDQPLAVGIERAVRGDPVADDVLVLVLPRVVRVDLTRALEVRGGTRSRGDPAPRRRK
jgi:hypothetical protein